MSVCIYAARPGLPSYVVIKGTCYYQRPGLLGASPQQVIDATLLALDR